MLFGIFFLVLFTSSYAFQSKNDVCTILSICDTIAAIRSEVAAVRAEQERQANILDGVSLSKITPNPAIASSDGDNKELCTLLSICNNLSEISDELAAIRLEQERQADLLEESCQTDTSSYPANCYEALKESQQSGVTDIRVPEYSKNPFKVACDQESHGGGWTIILRRTDGSEDFFREWKDYEEGFGQVDGEYFIGLAKLHALTSSARQELLVIVGDIEGERYEIYDNFKVGGEAKNYTLESVGSFDGTAGDALEYHVGMQFTTKDRDNDRSFIFNCAVYYYGAWWFDNCYHSNLTGNYRDKYMVWLSGLYWKPLNTAIMMIRPKAGAFKE